MKKFLITTIEIGTDYKSNNNIVIDDYTSGVFANEIGNILINKVEGGVSKFFKLVKVFRPMVDMDEGKFIVYSQQENKFFSVEEEGLVKLAYEDRI